MKINNPFEIINYFWNDKDFFSISKLEIEKYYFILNRRFAINFPIQAAYLSKYNINKYAVIKYWKDVITKNYNQKPKWLYLKIENKENKKDLKLENFSKEIINEFIKYYKLDFKNLKQAFMLYPNEIYNEIDNFSKIFNI